jgi:catechol 2,3-dioxygenase-like lactoylglutathione lyase family enzyme
MLHHVSLGTNDLERARAFYDPLMALLGMRLLKQTERILAYGFTETIFSLERPLDGLQATAGNGTHVAFHAGNRKTVHAFYENGLAHGGENEGAPATREYDPHYYAAFLLDPDGNKIEIVTFAGDGPC